MELRNGWLHGTDVRFEEWIIPTPAALSKPELLRHTPAFLTRDRTLAIRSGGGLLCEADVRETARILNLLEPSEASEAMRVRVVQGELGRHQDYATRPEWWMEAWRQGVMMRFATSNPTISAKNDSLQLLARQYVDGNRNIKTKEAWLEAQNLTRAWIEELAVAARGLGFDVLIGREMDTYRSGGPAAPEVFFALTDKALSQPRWLMV